MDATWFLKQRTKFIRFYYDNCINTFLAIQAKIEKHEPPFDNPVCDESGEPPYLDQWVEAQTAIDVAGLTCVSLLSDTIKLYFETLQHRVIGFDFGGTDSEKKSIFKGGFISAHINAICEILKTDWSDCHVDFDIIEQVVLARNCFHHRLHLNSFHATHDRGTLRKYPRPYFASAWELQMWSDGDSQPNHLLDPDIEISRENLFEAIAQTEKLAEWIDSRSDKFWDWRAAQRG